MSGEGQDLLKKILNTKPEARYTVENIRNHPWYQKNCNKNIVAQVFLSETSKINEEIIKEMESLGLSQEITRESIEKNKHNKYTSTYILLLKKRKNNEANEILNTKIAFAVSQPVSNPRGESYSINPRIKKVFEIKDNSIDLSKKEPKNSIRMTNNSIIEGKYIRPSPKRVIYGNSPNNVYRDPRAASTGFQGIRTAAMYIPREINLPISGFNKRSIRTGHIKNPSYNKEIGPLNISIRKSSPRAGTALDVSARKIDMKYNTFR